MKVFVTGATGFVGRHLCAHLVANGHSVTTVDSKSAPGLALEHLQVFNSTRFDRIYHLAAYTRAGDFCSLYGGDQWIINQKLNTGVLEWWHRFQPQAQILAFGTSVSYAKGFELTENNYLKDEPIERFYSYAMTKRMLLVGLSELAKQYKHRYVYAVPSTVYGPEYHLDGRDLHFIYDLIFKIIRGKKLGTSVVLWGDGHQKRELIHIRDFIRGLDLICNHSENQVFNLGTGTEHSIREFATLICRHVGYDFNKVQFDASKNVGLRSKVLDISKINKVVGFTPQISLEQGLAETIRWCETVEERLRPHADKK